MGASNKSKTAEAPKEQPNSGGGAVAALASKLPLPPGLATSIVEKALPDMVPGAATAKGFMSKAQPWKDFICPVSVPSASDGCSRVTANIYNFQTNYAILFVVQIVVSVITQPSALICIIMIVVGWVFFLKKNEDPDWKPEVGGVVMGPMQRWLLMTAGTAIILLYFAGGTICNATFMFIVC